MDFNMELTTITKAIMAVSVLTVPYYTFYAINNQFNILNSYFLNWPVARRENDRIVIWCAISNGNCLNDAGVINKIHA